jgi:hypothetical protein
MAVEYIPATYTANLDQMLARGAKPGQGGHLEGNAGEVKRAQARLNGYSFLATAIVNTLGMDNADSLLREAVKRLGRYRGNEIRREVERRGLSLDVEHLLNYWDTPREYSDLETVRQSHTREPHYAEAEIPYCPHHDQMMRLCPQRLAVLMCEEDHRAVAREFNPAIEVWYPALLTRGQAKRIFRFSMLREAADKAAHEAKQISEAATKARKPLPGERQGGKADPVTSYRALARINVIFYHYIADELLRRIGQEQTELILREAMRGWGTWRGRMMREDHQRRGWPLNIENFITYFDDLAAGEAWIAQNVTITPSEHTKDITASPYTDMFTTLGTGRFAVPMYEEALPAQAEAYHPGITVTIPKLMERGDSISRFRYELVI